MPPEALLPRLKALLGRDGCEEDALLTALLHQAAGTALAVTGRETLPPALTPAVLDMAVMRYNRLGTEGEASRAEGGVTVRVEELPKSIQKTLRRYTLAQAGFGPADGGPY